MTEEVMQRPTCGICGEPMPEGEEMFKYHGYSGSCPRPPLPKADPQKPVPISGLHLDAHSGRIKVSVEMEGKWVLVLDEPTHSPMEGHISHIVEPMGIRLCAEEGRPR